VVPNQLWSFYRFRCSSKSKDASTPQELLRNSKSTVGLLDLSATLAEDPVMNRRRAEKVSRALADATVLSILEAISARKEVTCGDIASLQGITPATVSHHLKVLADAGLIKCQREGPFVISRATGRAMQQYMRFLARMSRHKQS